MAAISERYDELTADGRRSREEAIYQIRREDNDALVQMRSEEFLKQHERKTPANGESIPDGVFPSQNEGELGSREAHRRLKLEHAQGTGEDMAPDRKLSDEERLKRLERQMARSMARIARTDLSR